MVSKTLQLVSFDNDGTMSGFFDGAVPAWRDALPILEEALQLPREEIGVRIGTEFALHGTHDYPWALSLAFARGWEGTVDEFVQRVERPFWDLQDEYRCRYVRAYPGVVDTLKRFRAAGVPVVCVSDAPWFMARARLSTAGISPYLDGVYALDCPAPEAYEVPSEQWLAFGHRRISDILAQYEVGQPRIGRRLPLQCEKPNPGGIQTAMRDFGVTDPSAVVHIGDSIPKDCGLLHSAGLADVLYVPDHAIGNLPSEYLYFITEVLKADPTRCPTAETKSVHPAPDNHGPVSAALLWLTPEQSVREVNDAY